MVQTQGETGQLPRTGLAALLAGADLPGEIELPDGSTVSVGSGSPVYRVAFRSEQALRTPMTELGIGNAIISGDIEIDGDIGALFEVRKAIQNKIPLRQKARFLYDFVRPTTAMNADAISQHYNKGDDFFLAFVDKRYRFYSHGLFPTGGESLEEASEHKLESMFNGLDLKPGMRLLDIGGGWGGVTEYCGARGVHVTSLTTFEDSARYIRRLIAEKDLPGEVVLQDFLEHRPSQPYDNAVIYGVIEHIPNYRKFAANLWRVLKPGGRLYLDASAAIQKFGASAFTRQYIWPGAHSFLNLQGLIAEFLYYGFEIVEVKRETHDYELTMGEWARRLDAAREEIIERRGVQTYRIFRLYLWAGTHAFQTNILQAYHVIAERRAEPGPRPSTARRLAQFLASVR